MPREFIVPGETACISGARACAYRHQAGRASDRRAGASSGGPRAVDGAIRQSAGRPDLGAGTCRRAGRARRPDDGPREQVVEARGCSLFSFALAALMVFVVGCSEIGIPIPTATPPSGIRGTVLLGPTCPGGQDPGANDPVPCVTSYAATLVILDSDGVRVTAGLVRRGRQVPGRPATGRVRGHAGFRCRHLPDRAARLRNGLERRLRGRRNQLRHRHPLAVRGTIWSNAYSSRTEQWRCVTSVPSGRSRPLSPSRASASQSGDRGVGSRP